MKYEIIKDKEKLLEFIDWLPYLKPTEKFYMALFARKKYDVSLQSTASDKMQLKRVLCNKHNMVQKIQQLEVDYGLYKLKDTIATQQSLALYITPNPRCTVKANRDLLIRLAGAVANGNFFHNVHAEAISSVQRSKSYTHVVDFDIDSKEIDLLILESIIPRNTYSILETRGGYHILVKPDEAGQYDKQWHPKIKNAYDCDQIGDQMIPVPGCTQGNFVPKFI